MAILTVGAGQQYQTIGAAIAASNNGDTINVLAGTYTNDTATIDTSITLQAIGGTVNLVETQALANEKGIFIVGDPSNAPTVTINGFSFSGAETPDGNNGAGIRYQAGNLTLNNDVFAKNQDGILATPGVAGTGTITIKDSEFASNGAGDGFSHNLYIGDVAQFTIENSYVHDAVVGHEIKSRAENNTITDNLIADNNGTSSYSIDLPNGGNATIAGNTIEQGPNGQNPVIIAYGEEGSLHTGTDLSISGNTFVNDLTSHAPTAVSNAGTAIANLSNDSFWGITPSQVAAGPNTQTGDVFLASRPVLVATVGWLGPSHTNRSGNFDTAANWAGGAVPGAGDAAAITTPGDYTVTDTNTVGDMVERLAIAAVDATLALSNGGNLTVLDGGRNSGTIDITSTAAASSVLQLAGTFTDNGSIVVGEGGVVTVDNKLALNGSGTTSLENAAMLSDGPTATLTNNSTIEGAASSLGGNGFTLVNGVNGVIDGDGGGSVPLALLAKVQNRGLLEATDAGGLSIQGHVANNGTIAAAGGDLAIAGSIAGTGNITIADGDTLYAGLAVAAGQTVTFNASSSGVLALGHAQSFKGTVAGLTDSDSVDLTNFAFSKAGIVGVSGSGAAGTDTVVTVKAGGNIANIALLNQFANQYAVNISAYTLASDHTGTTPGTVFELASPHMA